MIYAIELQGFIKHIKYLHNINCQVIKLDNCINLGELSEFALNEECPIVHSSDDHLESFHDKNTNCRSVNKGHPLKSVIITFDDSHISIYDYVFPILVDYGLSATFFVTVDNIDSANSVNWNQVREMSNIGMSIQSHTMTHPFLSDLSSKEIRWELQESKDTLEQQLGQPVKYLSLPGGRCNAIVKDIAKEAGYLAVCTSVIGYNDENTDPYSLKRWVIRKDMKFSTFSNIVHSKRSTLMYYETRQFLLNGLKKVLGNKVYASIHRDFTSKRVR